MKKFIPLVLFIAAVSLYGCGKQDETAPTISMNGKNPDTLIVKTATSYNDAGCTAQDDVDGNITANIIVATNINVNIPNRYLIFYTAEDKAGNISEKLTRTVEVIKPDATYNATSTCTGSSSNSVTITSFSNNDSITINNFYSSGTVMKAGLNNYKYQIVPVTFLGITVNGEIAANGTTLNGNLSLTGSITGPCTFTFTRN